MDEQTQAGKIKHRRSRAEVEQLVGEYEASGVGRTTFCQQRGLSLSTLSRYRRRQEQTAGEGAEGERWLAVEVTGSAAVAGGERSSGLAIVLSGGRQIEADAGLARRLVREQGYTFPVLNSRRLADHIDFVNGVPQNRVIETQGRLLVEPDEGTGDAWVAKVKSLMAQVK